MIVQTQVQPLRASEVLREVRMGDKVRYMWQGQELVGYVAGWRAIYLGNPRKHVCLIYRPMGDRDVPLSDIIARSL